MEGTIIRELENRRTDNRTEELIDFIHRIEPDVIDHLNQVNIFFPKFDSHNINHSQSVLSNMEKILGDKITQLSTMELFFLYMTALLHDCGMAISKQELNVLIACEGEEEDLSAPKFGLDGKGTVSLRAMKGNINQYRTQLYGDLLSSNVYEQHFIFGFQNEEMFTEHLALLAIDYHKYRNGRLPQLKDKFSDTNAKEINTQIRTEFLRANHAKLSRTYCKNLENKFDINILNNYGTVYSQVIGELCFSHGISFDEVQDKIRELSENNFENADTDLLFVAAMLRVADALHFGSDRVSYSLSYEKGTNNNIHWSSKLTGFNFEIDNNGGNVAISASSPCKKPEEYYFLKDYINYVEGELLNLQKCNRLNQLGLNINNKINAKGVTSCSEEFIPADDLCIKMDQSNIIDLLMSEELYKDKYACIRELYQNSLDACRCKQLNLPDFIGNIEFGIDVCTKHGKERKYLYCYDNGIGMDMSIITNYLLHVGHTFYSSAEFYQMRADSPKKFYPVSQFGIGILSCFMLCDLIEITTKKDNSDVICLTLDGKKEYLYFSTPLFDDAERLKNSGTIIKLFLKDDNISDEMPNKKILNDILMCQSVSERDTRYKEWDSFLDMTFFRKNGPENIDQIIKYERNYLLTILTRYIKLSPQNINIFSRCTGKCSNYKASYKSGSYFFINLNTIKLINMTYKQVVEKFSSQYQECNKIIQSLSEENVVRKEIFVNSQNLQYRNVLYFPKDYSNPINSESLLFYRVLEFHKSGFLIDGIAVQLSENLTLPDNYDVDFTLNSTGELRPRLSIDRRNIISVPMQIVNEMEELFFEVAKEELCCIREYFETVPDEYKTNISNIMWNYYFTSRRFLWAQIAKYLGQNTQNISWRDLSDNILSDVSLSDFLNGKKVIIKPNINYLMSTPFFKVIFANKIALSETIELNNNEIVLYSPKFKIDSQIVRNRFCDYDGMVYRKADFSQTDYRQYDVVNSLLPLVNTDFFNLLAENNKSLVKGNIIKGKINDNDIRFLYEVDSLSIFGNNMYSRFHPNEYRIRDLLNGKYYNYVPFNRRLSHDRSYLIYAFITSNLTTEQQEYVESLKDIYPDYYNGAINGWSILYTEFYDLVALPGIHNIEELLVRIPNSYWEESNGKSYLSNNKEITFETIQQLRRELNFN